MGQELLLSKKEDCSEEETGKQEEPISRQSVFHTAVFLLIVLNIFVTSSGLFGNVLLLEMHTTTTPLHEIESCFL